MEFVEQRDEHCTVPVPVSMPLWFGSQAVTERLSEEGRSVLCAHDVLHFPGPKGQDGAMNFRIILHQRDQGVQRGARILGDESGEDLFGPIGVARQNGQTKSCFAAVGRHV